MTDTASAPPPASRARIGLAVLSVSTFVAVTSELLPVGLIPQIAQGLDVSTATAGLAVSVFAVLVAALAIPLTGATARVPRKTLLVLSLAGYVVSNLVVAAAPSFGVLLAGRAVGGIAHAVFYSVVTAYASALVPAPRVGRALSIAFAGASLGTVLGVPLTTAIGTAAGWRTAFVAMAVFAAVLAVLVILLVPGVAAEPPHEDGSRYRRGRGLIAVIAADILVFLGHHTAYTYIAPLLGAAGVTPAGLSPALLVLGVVSLGGLVLAGLVGDRRLGAGYAGSAALIAVTLGVLPLLTATTAGSIADAAVWCLAYGAISPLITTAAVRTGAVSASTAGAVVNSASNVGITLGSLLGGGILATGAPWAIIAVPLAGAVLAASGAVVAASSRRGFPRGRAEVSPIPEA